MAYIKDIVINITRATKSLLLAGFGKPLILGESAPYYLLAAGSGNAGLKITAKTRGTVYIKVALDDPEGNNQALAVARTGAGTSGDPYVITVSLATNGSGAITSTATLVKAAIEASANANAIVAVALLGDGSGVMAAAAEASLADPGRYHEFSELKELIDYYTADDAEYKMAAAMFAQSPRPTVVAVYSRDPGAAIAATLAAVQAVNDTWYAFMINNRTKAEIHAAGTWANSNKKLFFGCTSDLTALDDRNNDREIIVIHDRPSDYPECAWVGQNLPKAPGSITWKWKSLNGQIAAAFNTTDLNTIRTKNSQTLTEYGSIVIMNEGKTTSGEFIDVIHGQDWVEAQLEARLFLLQTQNEKINLDNDGIAQVESVVRSVMIDAGRAGIIARATTDDEKKRSKDGVYLYTVDVPLRDEISVNDRNARHLPGVNFSYELAGAMHKITVNGKITG